MLRQIITEVHGIKRIVLLWNLAVKPVDKFHPRKDRGILQKIIQRSLHDAESRFRDRCVGCFFLVIGAERRLVKADQRVPSAVSADNSQALYRRGSRHGDRRFAGDQAQRRRPFFRRRELLSVGPPPCADLFRLQDRLTIDPERNPVSRLDFGPIQLCADRRRSFWIFQRTDASLQQRRCPCRVAERFQKECAFASGLLRDDHRPLLRKNIALVPPVGQTADVRAGDGLVSAQIDADMIVVF